MDPNDALEQYLEHRRSQGNAQSTIDAKRKRIGIFVEWLREGTETSLGELEGMDVHRYQVGRASQSVDGDDVAEKTLQSRMNEVRLFIEWAADVGLVDEKLPGRVQVPSPDSHRSQDSEVDAAAAESIMDWLSKFRYASRDHVIMVLFWRTAGRMGDVRALDVGDYYPDGLGDTDVPHMWIRHRPEQGTPLKNKMGGERPVNLKDSTCNVIDDYLERNRVDTTDDYGRKPLVTSRQGRPSTTTYQRTMYRITRPCKHANHCPHGRDESDCEAAQRHENASKCPSSESTHAVRRGALTELCRQDTPLEVISGRCDVTPEVLEEHYNQLGDLTRMKLRREYI